MNVDMDNFSLVRELIISEKLIEKSQIISFDLQFAGLKFQGNDRDRSEYLPAQKYQKMSAVARKYSIMQVGVTFFVPQQKSQLITAFPFNFYVFPRPTIYADPIISMQSGCVSFNITHKMDWNRWIEKGITYMKLTQIERINDIQQKAKKFDQLLEFLEDQTKTIVKDIINQIKTKDKYNPNKIDQTKFYQLPSSAFPFAKKVIQKYFEENGKLYVIKPSAQAQFSVQETIKFQILSITVEEKEQIQSKKLEDLYGFTLLFQKIWNSGKTFVGHNFFFDILFMYEAFIGALPFDYQLFKKNLRGKVIYSNQMISEQQQKLSKRTFYDTKYISRNLNYKFEIFEDNTTLENIYKAIVQKKMAKREIILPKQFERYELNNKILHEAGFDSYLTGWNYYQMMEISYSFYSSKTIPIEMFKNKINLNRSYFYVDMKSLADGVCEHERVFYIQVVEPKKFVQIDYIKKQRSETFKSLRQIFKTENILKDINIREGLKQVFIQIKQTKQYQKITSILVKYVKQNKIKDIYTLSHYLTAKNAKEWSDSVPKNQNGAP